MSSTNSARPVPVANYETLMSELAADFLYQMDSTGRIEWASSSVTPILGWKPEELAGVHSSELIHPDDLPKIAIRRNKLLAGAVVDDVQFRGLDKSGAYRWLSVRVREVTDSSGYHKIWIAAAHEIHEEMAVRKALEALSQGSEVLLRAINEIGLLQLMCETVVEAGRYRFATYERPVLDSEKTVEIVAWAGEHSGKLSELSATWGATPTGQGPTGIALRTGQVQFTDDFQHEKNTSPWAQVATEMGIRSSISLPVFVSGQLDGALVLFGSEIGEFSELTQGPLANLAKSLGYGLAQLREQNRQRAIIDSLLDPYVLLRPVRDRMSRIVDFIYLDANRTACEYMKMDRDALVGARLLALLPGHLETGILNLYSNVIESGGPLILNSFPYYNEILQTTTYSDVRAIKVGDDLSYTWRDITDRHAASVALAASEEQYRLLAENSTDVVVRMHEVVIDWISPSITDMLGWEQEELIGTGFDELLHSEDIDAYLGCRNALEDGSLHVTRFRMLAKDLEYHWVEIRAKYYVDANGYRDGQVASFHTIDTQVAAEQALERRARYDELTGLLNRNDILDRLSSISSHTLRTGHEIAVMFCDVDGFKGINDTYGHAAGDQVLRSIAVRIEGAVRSDDMIARIGGDEFLVILDGVHDLAEATEIAEKLREKVANPIPIPGGTVVATLSIGVTLAQTNENVDVLVARADEAMYQAKKAGSNQVIAISASAAE